MARFLYLYGVFNAVSIFIALALGYLRGAGEAVYPRLRWMRFFIVS